MSAGTRDSACSSSSETGSVRSSRRRPLGLAGPWRAHPRCTAVLAAAFEVGWCRRGHRGGVTLIGHECPLILRSRPREQGRARRVGHSLSLGGADEYCRLQRRRNVAGGSVRMSESGAVVRRPLNSPRAAALAGVLFAGLFTTALVLMRTSLARPRHRQRRLARRRRGRPHHDRPRARAVRGHRLPLVHGRRARSIQGRRGSALLLGVHRQRAAVPRDDLRLVRDRRGDRGERPDRSRTTRAATSCRASAGR